MSIDRRGFVASSAAALLIGRALPLGAELSRSQAPQLRYVVDTLGDIGNPRDAEDVARARRAGLTAFNKTVTSGESWESTLGAIADWDRVFEAQPNDFLKVIRGADIRRAQESGRIGVMLGTQNAGMVGGDLGRIDTLARSGVRIVQLTYNRRNNIGVGCNEAMDGGLTPFGRQVVERLNAQRSIVDLSHSGPTTCLEAARLSSAPIAITHTGCRALSDLPRNKTDEELRLVTSRGGYVGMYTTMFLTERGVPTARNFFEHVMHAIGICGENHVGVGTDGYLKGYEDTPAERQRWAHALAQRQASGNAAPGELPERLPNLTDLKGEEQYRMMAQGLSERGCSDEVVRKVLGLNFIAFAERVWDS